MLGVGVNSVELSVPRLPEVLSGIGLISNPKFRSCLGWDECACSIFLWRGGGPIRIRWGRLKGYQPNMGFFQGEHLVAE
jgi:hypothetical protein